MNLCCACRTPRVSTECEICQEPACKKCILHLGEDAFAFLPDVPEQLKKSRYCPLCYDSQVAPELAIYDEILARAKEVVFLTEGYRGEVPVIRKSKVEVRIAACADRDEVILRLAFLAARDGYNAVIKSVVSSVKVRNHSYVKSEWSGHGTPAVVDEKKLQLIEEREKVFR